MPDAVDRRRRRTTRAQRWFVNPIMRLAIGAGLLSSAYALVETTGRRSGRRRVTPVGYQLDGDTVWLVAEHGRASAYIMNLLADPQVRVRVRRRWRSGVAHVLDDDDGLARRRAIDQGNGPLGRLDGKTFRRHATDPLTVRIDLSPASETFVSWPQHL